MDDAQARREQFATLVEQWLPGIYGYFRKLGLAVATAEDLSQETFLAAWRNLASLRDPEKLRSWLYGIAYRQYLRYRRQHTVSSLEHTAETDLPVGDDPGSEKNVASQAVRNALRELPEKYRQPLVLIYWEELSYHEAARVLSLPLGTLAWRVQKALRLVQHALAEEGASHAPERT